MRGGTCTSERAKSNVTAGRMPSRGRSSTKSGPSPRRGTYQRAAAQKATSSSRRRSLRGSPLAEAAEMVVRLQCDGGAA